MVDSITFKFQTLDDFDKLKISNYLLQLGFNSYQESGKLVKPIQESILVNTSKANHYQMLSRETISKNVNRVMPSVSNQFTDKPNITSHSFRVG